MAERYAEIGSFRPAVGRLVIPLRTLFLIFLLTASPLMVSAEITYRWVLPEKPLKSKTRVTCQLILNLENPELLTVNMGDLPEGVFLNSGPHLRPIRERNDDRKWVTRTRITWYLYLGSPGIYKMPDVELEIAGMKQVVELEDFIVLYPDELDVPYPSQAEWSSPLDSYYEGQSFPLSLRLENQTGIEFPSKISARFPDSFLQEGLDGYGTIENRVYGEDILYSLPGKTWMMTPLKEGTYTVSYGRLYHDDLRRAAPPIDLTVLPVPPEISQSGAVGSFVRTTAIEKVSGHLNELIYRVVLKGEGNMTYLTFPDPEITGGTIKDVEERFSLQPTPRGWKGSRIKEYHLAAEAGRQSALFINPSYAYLETDEDNGNPVVRMLKEEEQSVDLDSFFKIRNFSLKADLLTPEQVLSTPLASGPGPVFYGFIFLPGLLLLLLSIIVPGNKISKSGTALLSLFLLIGAASSWLAPLEKTEALYREGKRQDALASWDEIYREHPRGGILYNEALAYGGEKQWLDSLFYLRKARRLSVSASGPLISKLEEEFNFPPSPWKGRQTVPPFLIIIPAVLLYAGGGLLVIFKKSGRYIFLTLTVCSLVLSLGTAAITLSIHARSRQNLVLLEGDTEVRKLPDSHTSASLSLPAGTDVRVMAEENGFLLIDNGYSVEGWITSQGQRYY